MALPSDPQASLAALKNLTKMDPLVDPEAFANLIAQQKEQRRMLGVQAQFPATYATGATPEGAADITKSNDPFVGVPAQKQVADTEAANQALNPNSPQTQVHAQGVKEKLAELMAPNQAKAAGDVALEQAKTQRIKDMMGMTQPSGAAGAPGSLQMSEVNAQGEPIFKTVQPGKDPQLVQAQQHDALMGLQQLGTSRAELASLEQEGAVGGVRGMVTGAATKWGMNPLTDLLHITPQNSAREISRFQAQKELTLTNLARVHGGSRAAASPAIMANWRTLVNNATTPDALRGVLDTAGNWLKTYAGAKSGAEQDALDSQLLDFFSSGAGGSAAAPSSDPSTWAKAQ